MECQQTLNHALNSLTPFDRQIIALRHVEELSNAEAATVLGVEPVVAGKLYIRAMQRLTARLKDNMPGTFRPFDIDKRNVLQASGSIGALAIGQP